MKQIAKLRFVEVCGEQVPTLIQVGVELNLSLSDTFGRVNFCGGTNA